MTTPGAVGTQSESIDTTHMLGAPASIVGSELPRWLRYGTPALRFAPVLCRYNRRTSSGEEEKGLGFRWEAPALSRALSRPRARCSIPKVPFPLGGVLCVRGHR
jgi:hypothetical protein